MLSTLLSIRPKFLPGLFPSHIPYDVWDVARAKQYVDRVNVIKRIKVNGEWPFAPAVERSGRIVYI
jgi:hypothetical protein